ncbi:unnamed protein product [Effrenium voratum]|nr:unnamed protein product [Effrenium voratum]
MAQMNPPRMQPSRQRSASPTLENWLSRRGTERTLRERAPGASHRASSLPSRERERDQDEEELFPRPVKPLDFDLTDRSKRWAEIVEEEHHVDPNEEPNEER